MRIIVEQTAACELAAILERRYTSSGQHPASQPISSAALEGRYRAYLLFSLLYPLCWDPFVVMGRRSYIKFGAESKNRRCQSSVTNSENTSLGYAPVRS